MKDYVRGLLIVLITSVVVGVGLSVFVIKKGLLLKLTMLMRENIILSMLIIIPLILNSFTNFVFGLGLPGYYKIFEGRYNRVWGLMPVYNGVKISDLYFSSEEEGLIGHLPKLFDILLFVYFVGGLIYLNKVDGFYIFSPAIVLWASILYGLYFITVGIKSIVIGLIAHTLDNDVPFKTKYYRLPMILGIIVLLYYIGVPILLLTGGKDIGLKASLMNTIVIIYPILMPIYIALSSRRVTAFVHRRYEL